MISAIILNLLYKSPCITTGIFKDIRDKKTVYFSRESIISVILFENSLLKSKNPFFYRKVISSTK